MEQERLADGIGVLDGFPIRMVSQAASRQNLTIVLRDAGASAARSRLHEELPAEVAA